MTPEDFKSKTIVTDADGQLGVIINQSRLRELLNKEERLEFFEAAKPGFDWSDFFLMGFIAGSMCMLLMTTVVIRFVFDA